MTGIHEPDDRPAERAEWEDIEDAARGVFDLWVGQPELGWARLAWEALDQQSLTRYEDELERTVVLIRLLALGEVYRDFCAVTWQESHASMFGVLAEEIELSPFRLGQLVGPDFTSANEYLRDEPTSEAVRELVYEERPRVIRALTAAFRHTAELFVGLYLSTTHLSGHRWEELDDDVIDEVLNDVSTDKSAGYSWIEEGMPVFR